MNDTNAADGTTPHSRLLRDVVTFQVKLVLDSAKTVVLSPASLVAALMDLLSERDEGSRRFDGVLRAGWRFERWLNPFAALHRDDGDEEGDEEGDGLDDLLERVEETLRDPERREELTGAARRRIEGWLDAAGEKRRR